GRPTATAERRRRVRRGLVGRGRRLGGVEGGPPVAPRVGHDRPAASGRDPARAGPAAAPAPRRPGRPAPPALGTRQSPRAARPLLAGPPLPRARRLARVARLAGLARGRRG